MSVIGNHGFACAGAFFDSDHGSKLAHTSGLEQLRQLVVPERRRRGARGSNTSVGSTGSDSNRQPQQQRDPGAMFDALIESLPDMVVSDGCDKRDSDFTFIVKPLFDQSAIDSETSAPLSADEFFDLTTEDATEGLPTQPNSNSIPGENASRSDDELTEGGAISIPHLVGAFPTIYAVSMVCRRFDSSAKRGAAIRGLVALSTLPNIDAVRTLLVVFLQAYVRNPEQSVIDSLLDVLQSDDVAGSLTHAFMSSKRLLPFIGHVDEAALLPFDVRLPTSISLTPVHLLVPQVGWGGLGPPAAKIRELIAIFGVADVMGLFHAILASKKILVTGNSAGSVSLVVMTLASLVVPAVPFERLLLRLFPYTSLSNVDFFKVPGFIAGTTNTRMVEAFAKDWNVHIDLIGNKISGVNLATTAATSGADRGKEKKEGGAKPSGLGNFLSSFEPISDRFGRKIQSVATSVSSTALELVYGPGDDGARLAAQLTRGAALQLSETWFHAQFRQYTQLVADIVLGELPIHLRSDDDGPNGKYWRQIRELATESKLFARTDDRTSGKLDAAQLDEVEDVRKYVRQLGGLDKTQPLSANRRKILSRILAVVRIHDEDEQRARANLTLFLEESSKYGVALPDLLSGVEEEPLRSELVMLVARCHEQIHRLSV